MLGIVGGEAVLSRLLRYQWSTGPAIPLTEINALGAITSVIALGLAVGVVRWDGVTFSELGVQGSLLWPAVVTVGGFFLVFNLVGIGLALMTGHPETVGYHWTVPPFGALVVFLVMFLIAGLFEEFVFRGYLQTKLIAMFGDTRIVGVVAGVILASVLFSLAHLPRVLVGSVPNGLGATNYLLLLVGTGIAYGILYELTQNLWIPVLVHTAGNMPGTAGILFVSTAGWPAWATGGFQVAYLVLVLGMIVGYRWGARSMDWFPVWSTRIIGSRV